MARQVLEAHKATLDGHRVSYRTAGQGPVLLWLHGIANSSATWEPVAGRLARRFTLVAPELSAMGVGDVARGLIDARATRESLVAHPQ